KSKHCHYLSHRIFSLRLKLIFTIKIIAYEPVAAFPKITSIRTAIPLAGGRDADLDLNWLTHGTSECPDTQICRRQHQSAFTARPRSSQWLAYINHHHRSFTGKRSHQCHRAIWTKIVW